MIVLQLMKTHVVTVPDNATIGEAIDLIDLYQVSGLPVINSKGVLCGYISEKDIYKRIIKGFNGSMSSIISITAHAVRIGSELVRDLMTSPAISVGENSLAMDAADLMMCKKLKRIPVVSDQGQLIGTINRIDICRALVEGTINRCH